MGREGTDDCFIKGDKMTKEEALYFLRQHQPMPDNEDEVLDLIKTFDDVRRYFIKNPDPECIPLFLNAFSNGMGYGVYQITDEAFRDFDASLVISHLKKALRSPYVGVRWWAAHWAVDYPSEELIDPLKELLNEEDVEDAHYHALMALEWIWKETGSQKALCIIKERGKIELDPERIDLIQEILSQENVVNKKISH